MISVRLYSSMFEIYLTDWFLVQVPGLVNKNQLKEGKDGAPRLIGQVK